MYSLKLFGLTTLLLTDLALAFYFPPTFFMNRDLAYKAMNGPLNKRPGLQRLFAPQMYPESASSSATLPRRMAYQTEQSRGQDRDLGHRQSLRQHDEAAREQTKIEENEQERPSNKDTKVKEERLNKELNALNFHPKPREIHSFEMLDRQEGDQAENKDVPEQQQQQQIRHISPDEDAEMMKLLNEGFLLEARLGNILGNLEDELRVRRK